VLCTSPASSLDFLLVASACAVGIGFLLPFRRCFSDCSKRLRSGIRRRRRRGCLPFERDHCRAPDKEFSRIRWLSPQRSTWPAPKAQYLGIDVRSSFSWRRTDTCAGIPRLRRWSLGGNLRACHPAPVHTSGEWRRRHRRRSREAGLQDRARSVSSRHAAQSHSHVRMTAICAPASKLSMATETTCSTLWQWRSKS
jgi:hypothetical protein